VNFIAPDLWPLIYLKMQNVTVTSHAVLYYYNFGQHILILYMIFRANIGDNNDDV